jgi:hypothetical protein
MRDNSLTGENVFKILHEYFLLCSKRSATLQIHQNVGMAHHEDLQTESLTDLTQM